ncbi:pyridine nucleotide-disulfide oxidoreductase [Microbacterium sp. CH12i]|uniref:NAD(P)/FAD-dependent oxidoreductase n=1 Tax=Microbacterium sp. CH12i TaxID=1479651 RepID=UPI0004612690|nr:FAD-dependent oxidoreductase [Microbacterium sp. CH12i]KDA04846.1 pyridine nucleotide-disulfide oxidoreductase [Microbacterium sp. CH12i]
MNTVQNVIVIGGGLAAGKTAEALRQDGYEGAVTLIAAENHLPYERPSLSKDYLFGRTEFDDALVHSADWYQDHDITVRQGVTATAIDIAGHTVTLGDGSTLPYDKLVLATGSIARHLPLPGADADGIHYLRTVEESDAIRATFGQGKRLVLIGGGWIGLEVAAAARASDTTVTILEGGKLPLLRVLGDEIAQVFADLHTANGVDLRTDVQIAEITTEHGRATGVRLADGEGVPADAIVIGIGVSPEVEIAKAAGIAVDNGVLVDAALRTSDPDVFAVGDIANHQHPILGQRVRVEHWATALNQPAAAVSALLGNDTEYTELPYFYSDQYDLGCEYIGYASPGSYDRVVIRGSLAKREFVAFWLDAENRILAAMNVNVWDVIDQIKPLIASHASVDPERLMDPEIPYAQL